MARGIFTQNTPFYKDVFLFFRSQWQKTNHATGGKGNFHQKHTIMTMSFLDIEVKTNVLPPVAMKIWEKRKVLYFLEDIIIQLSNTT